jgi:hypothetical protein
MFITETIFVSLGITFKLSGELEQDEKDISAIVKIGKIDLLIFRIFIIIYVINT